MKQIKLTKEKWALVDDEYFDELNKSKWYCHSQGYAIKSINIGVGKQTKIYMHKIILKTPKGKEIDHIDGNKLNNQKSNLRIVMHSENLMNRGKFKNNKSGYKGVSFHKSHKKWRSVISVNKKQIHLGYFNTKFNAYNIYYKACLKYYGEFARI